MDKGQLTPVSDTIPVLFDTDIGSDIDDAVALAYLLRQPRCALVGVTTVSGQARARAMLADALCRAAGRDDIPIYSGAETPLLVEQRQPIAQQATVLDRWPHREDFAPNMAVGFMRDTIRSRPGEITLLSVGPLTNVGLLFALDPEIPRLLRGLVMMCGVFTNRVAGAGLREWNAMLDPHATAIVYRAPVVAHTSVGLEVTTRCQIGAEVFRARFRGGPLDVVADMAEVWFSKEPVVTFHDPLAAAILFAPDLCGYEHGHVTVELASARVMGMTHWDKDGPEMPHRIALTVEPGRFFEHYFGVVKG